MPDEQLARIIEYTKTINQEAGKDANLSLLKYVIAEVYDRTLLYLNASSLDGNLERVVARIVSGIFNQTTNSLASTGQDTAISSMSDNGQSISFSNEIKNYLSTTDDNELFAGSARLLAPYRRINVVS